jgi:RNA 3'-terminal phosphate cyclase (ATP)
MIESIVLDGSTGEGGGQILRTGTALSAITGTPVEIVRIRSGRSKPGLAAQHLAGIRAVAAACDGHLEGDFLGSERVALHPSSLRAGTYEIDVASERPSAGAVTLVLQALLPVLALAPGPSKVLVEGGTHVEWSPSVHYLDRVLCPALLGIGVQFRVMLKSWGWFPRGGGAIEVDVEPGAKITPANWTVRGSLRAIEGVSVVNGLPRHIAERQARAARELLKAELRDVPVHIEEVSADGPGQGTLCFLLAEYGSSNIDRAPNGPPPEPPAGFSTLGRRGKPAEAVGIETARALLAHHHSGAVVERHLADQVLPFLALASGESRLTTEEISAHLRTNAWVCEKMLETQVSLQTDRPCRVEVRGAGAT